MRLARQQLAGHVPHVTFRGATSPLHIERYMLSCLFATHRSIILKPVVGHAPETGTTIQRKTPNKPRDRRLPGHLVGIHRVHLELVVRTLRRPTGRVLKRKSRRQSEAVKNRPQSQSN